MLSDNPAAAVLQVERVSELLPGLRCGYSELKETFELHVPADGSCARQPSQLIVPIFRESLIKERYFEWWQPVPLLTISLLTAETPDLLTGPSSIVRGLESCPCGAAVSVARPPPPQASAGAAGNSRRRRPTSSATARRPSHHAPPQRDSRAPTTVLDQPGTLAGSHLQGRQPSAFLSSSYTSPVRERVSALHQARAAKVSKNGPTAEHLGRAGLDVALDAFVVGSLWAWDPANGPMIKYLVLSRAAIRYLAHCSVSTAVHHSKEIYLRHVIPSSTPSRAAK
ncbi:hypothetical protein FOCC_FOCC013954 [Frankliniella occidentalis]|nr:hypothetical protein FOCC_FOCC013954 [Frankliniella occidentalis]